jgi:acetyl-CoA C-acetyltransferase
MSEDAARIPVIVGVGQVNDRPATPDQGLDSLGLMEAALRAADADAGGGWLPRLESLAAVYQMSFPSLGDVSAPLASAVGAKPRICHQTASPSGDSPILLLNEAAQRIAAGEITVAAVAGGEALRTAAQRAAAAAGGSASDHNIMRQAVNRARPSMRQRYGLMAPVDVYPLYENAGRAAYGQSLAEAQAESGEIWSLFSKVAAENPAAWIRKPVSADEVIEPSAGNRPIAFPYNKLMVANSSVNQGAAFIITSLAEARVRGVPEERLVFVGAGAAAHEPNDILARDRYDRSPSMAVTLRRTLELNELTSADLDFVELYSCVPCVPKMARRVIDWPADKPATVFGGLTFGGGPIGNYMSHAAASMVLALRQRGRKGLLFANGGFATHNHAIVLSREPARPETVLQSFDYQAEADAARAPAPTLIEDYTGPGGIESYTVLYERDSSPRFGSIIGRTPAGQRFLAKIPASDAAGLTMLTNGETEPVGTGGVAVPGAYGDVYWTRG